jgi:hypothetical protein
MHRHLVLAEIIQSYEFAIYERTTPCSPYPVTVETCHA